MHYACCAFNGDQGELKRYWRCGWGVWGDAEPVTCLTIRRRTPIRRSF